ncbi:hypothetical protein LMH87_000219 [Akanthomyces muscarius]|uniref:Uncharacterized protein n=1 Tax=Akanthomyces muscarius TaxID=2231603 RepID=A0A9W8QE40_AKAMU|nr:hypothetical protein LMH87_000219 [Akanthomyces muscarius]KAJ4154949.1 hypothetical protein LMH87_000219 [Akanthomyces muscarius]
MERKTRFAQIAGERPHKDSSVVQIAHRHRVLLLASSLFGRPATPRLRPCFSPRVRQTPLLLRDAKRPAP